MDRCYAALDALKQRTTLHWRSDHGGSGDYQESWMNGEDYMEIMHWDLPEGVSMEDLADHEKQILPRTDTYVRYNGIGYSDVREDPDLLVSKVLGLGVTSLSDDWDFSIAEDFLISFYERSNCKITFPAGVGVISDEMVRFCTSWEVVGMDIDEATAQLTYRFDDGGNLVYMEYLTTYDETPRAYTIEVYDDTAEEIDALLRSQIETLYVPQFSWEEAQEKYTDGTFNIRQDSFVNTSPTPVTDSVEAARLALREYPNLTDYLSIRTYHDDTAGMWKVTINSYYSYQASDEYRDIYLDDNGITHLLVYEGPIEWDQTRR